MYPMISNKIITIDANKYAQDIYEVMDRCQIPSNIYGGNEGIKHYITCYMEGGISGVIWAYTKAIYYNPHGEDIKKYLATRDINQNYIPSENIHQTTNTNVLPYKNESFAFFTQAIKFYFENISVDLGSIGCYIKQDIIGAGYELQHINISDNFIATLTFQKTTFIGQMVKPIEDKLIYTD